MWYWQILFKAVQYGVASFIVTQDDSVEVHL